MQQLIEINKPSTMSSVEYLYVCSFSNGWIKVGRTNSPRIRLMTHSNRLACVGIVIDESHVVKCDGDVLAAEDALIGRCADAAETRNKLEWFFGLDYQTVREWAIKEATANYPVKTTKIAASQEDIVSKLNDFFLGDLLAKRAVDRLTSMALCLQGMLVHMGVESEHFDVCQATGGSRFSMSIAILMEGADNFVLSALYAEAAEAANNQETAQNFISTVIKDACLVIDSVLSRQQGLPIGDVTDPRFWRVHSYHESVLQAVVGQVRRDA